MVDDDSYLNIRLEVSVPPDAYAGRNPDTVKLATKVCVLTECPTTSRECWKK